MKTRISWIFYCLVSFMLLPSLSAAERFVTNKSNGFTWIQQGKAYPILVDSQEDKGVLRAVANLQTDAGKVTGATPEIIHSRANSQKEHMGLTTWKDSPDGKIHKSDVTVSKNYLSKEEISSLNDIVTMYLDYAENQAKRNKLMSMQDWIDKLDSFLKFNEYELLHNAGFISSEVAKKLAIKEYEIFRIKQDESYVSDFDATIKKYK